MRRLRQAHMDVQRAEHGSFVASSHSRIGYT
jgi:hypothetical protein